jgi:hypothetical protein
MGLNPGTIGEVALQEPELGTSGWRCYDVARFTGRKSKVTVTDRSAILNLDCLGGGTGRRTGLKIAIRRVIDNLRSLPKTTEQTLETSDRRGFEHVYNYRTDTK